MIVGVWSGDREIAEMGYSGDVVDRLLGYAETLLGHDQRAVAVRAVREAIRSQRPNYEFAWTDQSQRSLEDAIASSNGDAARLLRDALEVANGSPPLNALEKWNLRGVTTPTDARLELGPFRTTRSLDAEVRRTFMEYINSERPLDVVIRGHLWIERGLVELIRRMLRRPDQLDPVRLTFAQYAALAFALGAIDHDELGLIRQINRLRNRVAHSLDEPVSEVDQVKLISGCSSDLANRIAPNLTDMAFPEGITTVIAYLVVVFHANADEIDAQSRYEEFYRGVAAKVLAEGDGHNKSSA